MTYVMKEYKHVPSGYLLYMSVSFGGKERKINIDKVTGIIQLNSEILILER